MALARLTGGPLDGQILPLDSSTGGAGDDSLIVPYGEGQVVYRRAGAVADDGGPAETRFVYVEATEPIDPAED